MKRQLFIAVLIFAGSAYLASYSALSGLETSIFNAVYENPRWLYAFFLVVTQAGSIYMLMAVALAALIIRHYHGLIRLLLSGLSAYLLAGLAKDLVGRARPAELLADVVARDFFVYGPGFPSGHTALAAAIGLTVASHVPKKYIWIPVVGIVLVAWSRVYLGAHAPLDVVGGFTLGWIPVLLFQNLTLKGLKKS